MKWVIDSNCLEDPILGGFLGYSKSNFAVIADYVMMEAYKTNAIETFPRRMSILVQYPDQILILKPTTKLALLSGKAAGLTRRMIEPNSAAEFREFSADIQKRRHSPQVVRAIQGHSDAAAREMDSLLDDASMLFKGFNDVSAVFTDHEKRLFRTGARMTMPIIQKTMSIVEDLTWQLLAQRGFTRQVSDAEFKNLVLFRFALAGVLLAIRWIRKGEPKEVKPERTRNDLIDMILATYGTYFDGVLSNDKALCSLWGEASAILGILRAPTRVMGRQLVG